MVHPASNQIPGEAFWASVLYNLKYTNLLFDIQSAEHAIELGLLLRPDPHPAYICSKHMIMLNTFLSFRNARTISSEGSVEPGGGGACTTTSLCTTISLSLGGSCGTGLGGMYG